MIQGDQKVSVNLMITVQSSGAQRLFDYPVFVTKGMPLPVTLAVFQNFFFLNYG
jgi:hypothetical protein